jgi:hypothetical protein
VGASWAAVVGMLFGVINRGEKSFPSVLEGAIL